MPAAVNRISKKLYRLGVKSNAQSAAIVELIDAVRAEEAKRLEEHAKLLRDELGFADRGNLMPTAALNRMYEALRRIEVTPGTCRYCGCTDNAACAGGCSWADDAETVCSACVDEGM